MGPIGPMRPISNATRGRQEGLGALVDPFGCVAAGLVKNDQYIGLAADELVVISLYSIALGVLGLDNEDDVVHVSGHRRGGTGLAERRHVEEDIVEIALFDVR